MATSLGPSFGSKHLTLGVQSLDDDRPLHEGLAVTHGDLHLLTARLRNKFYNALETMVNLSVSSHVEHFDNVLPGWTGGRGPSS